VAVEEHTITLEGLPVFYRSAPAPSGQEAAPPPGPALYLHTAPTSSDDWSGLLERTGGLAPDLIGFGRSAKGGHLDYSPAGLAQFVSRLCSHLGIESLSLVGHGWGAAVAVLLAARDPASVRRLVLIDPAPPLAPERWHRLARIWRTPVIGELAMGSTGRMGLARILRSASAHPTSWPDRRARALWEQFDQGTQRATLRLHRWAAPESTRQVSDALAALTMPCLLLWGERDSWFPPALADGWLAGLPHATLARIAGAGHWPWLDQPEAADLIAGFLGAD
jgi:pimeloyl-ACP methyl ester carboxylesterase